MDICIVGTGYVGLVTGTCLAAKGHNVTCVDSIEDKVNAINNGQSPIHEAGLDELLRSVIGKQLHATTDLHSAVLKSRVTIIAVGTPYAEDRMDASYLQKASEQIGAALAEKDDYHVVVVKSTVVPGTTESIVGPVLARTSGRNLGTDFDIAMNPEFLREGCAVGDFMDPDRIVAGTNTERASKVLAELYNVFPKTPFIETSIKTAEMIKYTSNALLATLISFSNEIANLCAEIGDIDVVDVMRGVHADGRISPRLPDGTTVTPGIASYVEAGCGFGGSCFPKDVKALIAHGKSMGQPMPLLSSVIDVNQRQPARMLALLADHYPALKGLTVAVLGLAFKPETDDMRESPAIPVVRSLLSAGAYVRAYDPIAAEEARKVFDSNGVKYDDTLESAVENADAIMLMTSWPEFARLPSLIAGRSPAPLIVDGRRMLARDSVDRYEGIGLRVSE